MTTPKAQSTSKASYRVTARDGSGEHLTVGPFTTTEAAEHLATTLATVGIYRTIEITTEQMHHETARFKAERDLARQSTQHHIRRERELESIVADLIAHSKHKPRCHCKASQALRQLAEDLHTPDRQR